MWTVKFSFSPSQLRHFCVKLVCFRYLCCMYECVESWHIWLFLSAWVESFLYAREWMVIGSVGVVESSSSDNVHETWESITGDYGQTRVYIDQGVCASCKVSVAKPCVSSTKWPSSCKPFVTVFILQVWSLLQASIPSVNSKLSLQQQIQVPQDTALQSK